MIQEIPLDKIAPSPTNPRKRFDESKLAELAESIRSKGVLQPVLVRHANRGPVLDDFTLLVEIAGKATARAAISCVEKLEKAGLQNYGQLLKSYYHDTTNLEFALLRIDKVTKAEARAFLKAVEELKSSREKTPYELVAGERRWRAAQLAGLKTIPVIVRDLSDVEVLEVQVIENEQREDTTALEKAIGYAQLIESGRYTVETMANKVGKAESTIRSLLRLRNLPAKAAEALDAGELSPAVAQLIASGSSPAMREKAAGYALTRQERWASGQRVQDLPSYRDVKDWIQRECTIELKQAPFNVKEEGLAGACACTTCPKRTGNCREEYPDARADVCTDPACYREKLGAWQSRTLADAEVKGQTVLNGADAKKLFPYSSSLDHKAPYFDLADQCWEDRKKKTPRSYKQLLEKHLDQKDVVLAFDSKGSLHRLVHKDVAIPILREQHGLHKPSSNGYTPPEVKTTEEQKREEAKRREASHLERETKRGILAAAAAAGEAVFAKLPVDDPQTNLVLRVLLRRAIEDGWGSVLEDVAGQRGVKGKRKAEQVEGLLDVAAQSGGPKLLGLLVEFAAARLLLGYSGNWTSPAAQDLATALGLSKKAIEQEVRARLKEEKKARKAAKGKPQSKKPGPRQEVEEATAAAESGLFAGVSHPDEIRVEDLELPAAIVESLRKGEFLTVGDLRAFQHGDKSLSQSLAALPGLSFQDGRLVAQAVEYVLSGDIRSCRTCGCTYSDPCPEGCSWVEDDLCSGCCEEKEE